MSGRQRNVEQLRDLNDLVRLDGPRSNEGVRWLLTPGINALGGELATAAIRAVCMFEKFDHDNDPHGEHDFGSFELAGHRIFWKIDYYDREMVGHSPDATDQGLTCRLLTIMLASEY